MHERDDVESAPVRGLPAADGRPLFLVASGISKSFGPTHALDSVDLTVRTGEIVGIVGENGAGKSTLKNVLCGLVVPDSGDLTFEGQRVAQLDTAELGIAAVHQEFSLFGTLSVAENICIAEVPTTRFLVDWSRIAAVAQEYLDAVGGDIDPDALVDSLSTGKQQLVEIAKALRTATRLLILDEPTAALTAPERDHLFSILRRLRDRGMSIVFISHFLEEVYEVTDRVVVMRDGRSVAERATNKMPRREMEELMVGRAIEPLHERVTQVGTSVELSATHVASLPQVHDVSFELHQGEILGLAGLIGAGRTETAEAIFGLRPFEGTVTVGDQRVPRPTPDSMQALGLVFVPEDRRRHGLFPVRSVRENLTASAIRRFVRRRICGVGFSGEAGSANAFADQMHIIRRDIEVPVGALSGGNQQKTLLGRWLAREPRIYLLDEPTRGVDIGAKQEIHELIRSLAASGRSVLLISSELEELFALCHRMLVLRAGRVVGEFDRGEFNAAIIVGLAASDSETERGT